MKKKIKFFLSIIVGIIVSILLYKLIPVFNDTTILKNNFDCFLVFLIVTIGIYELSTFNKTKFLKYFNNKCILITSFVLSIVYSFCLIIGRELQRVPNIDFNVGLLLNVLIYTIIFFVILVILFNKANSKENIRTTSFILFRNSYKSLIINMLIFIIPWIFLFFVFYPGVYTNDSISSLMQATGNYPISNHHPVLFTLLIKLFISLNDNIYVGLTLYNIFQMLALSFTFAFVIKYMASKKVDYKIQIITMCFYFFSLVNAMYSFTMWKDIPFAIIFVYLIIIFIEIISTKDFLKKNINKILLFIVLLLFFLFRNNGIYIYLVALLFILFLLRKDFLRIFLISVVAIGLYFVIEGPIFEYYNIQKGSKVEALSIPIQQIARVETFNSKTLSLDEKNKVERFIPIKYAEGNYLKTISDPMKSYIRDNGDINNTNFGDFFDIWYTLLKKYPKTYIKSFLYNSYGYWYPEVIYWKVAEGVYDNILEIKEKPLISLTLYASDKTKKISQKPIIGLMYSIGFMFWLNIFLMAVIIIKKKYKLLIPGIFFIGLMLTVMASPVYAEFRYVYSIFTCMPLLIMVVFNTKRFIK